MLKKRFGLLLTLCCFAQVCFAQSAATATVVVPITKEPSHHLVFENEYVRVFKVEVAPHAETLYHKHDVDYVFVTLGDSDVESVRLGEPPVRLQLKDGETRFTNGGFAHKAVNRRDKPFVNVTVELKKAKPAQVEIACNVCTKVWRQSKPKASVKKETLYETDQLRITRWQLDGAFRVPPEIDMNNHLLVALGEFLLERGVTHPESKIYGTGDVRWNEKGKYFWRPETDAAFVIIEMKR